MSFVGASLSDMSIALCPPRQPAVTSQTDSGLIWSKYDSKLAIGDVESNWSTERLAGVRFWREADLQDEQ